MGDGSTANQLGTGTEALKLSLQAKFNPADIEWRVQQCGFTQHGPWAMVLAYVTNRAVQQRLDDVCGCLGWKNEYQHLPEGVMCGLSIKDPGTGEWVTKWDGAEETQVEKFKGGISGAMKRAAVNWGIGRYLYHLEVTFAHCTEKKPVDMTGWNKGYDTKTQKTLYWLTPDLPAWAKP